MLKDLIPGMGELRWDEDDSDRAYRDCRQVVRMRCHYDVEYRFAGEIARGQVVDIGIGGMKLRCSVPPRVDDSVEVFSPEPEPRMPQRSVPCRAEWVRGRELDGALFVGLTYDASNELLGRSWVKVLLKELGFRPERTFQRRRFLRAEGFVPVRVGLGRGTLFPGTLSNLGVQGALLEASCPLDPGVEAELEIGPFEELPSFLARGTVAQLSGGGEPYLLGVRFEDLSPEAIATLGRYLRHLLLNHWEV